MAAGIRANPQRDDDGHEKNLAVFPPPGIRERFGEFAAGLIEPLGLGFDCLFVARTDRCFQRTDLTLDFRGGLVADQIPLVGEQLASVFDEGAPLIDVTR